MQCAAAKIEPLIATGWQPHHPSWRERFAAMPWPMRVAMAARSCCAISATRSSESALVGAGRSRPWLADDEPASSDPAHLRAVDRAGRSRRTGREVARRAVRRLGARYQRRGCRRCARFDARRHRARGRCLGCCARQHPACDFDRLRHDGFGARSRRECRRQDTMRGADERTGELFSYVDIEERVPLSHPLRLIRRSSTMSLANLMVSSPSCTPTMGDRRLRPPIHAEDVEQPRRQQDITVLATTTNSLKHSSASSISPP